MCRVLRTLFYVITFLAFVTCTTSGENELERGNKNKIVTREVELNATQDSNQNLANRSGILGVFNIPEMLAMVILDSAKQEFVANKRARNYAIIEKEMVEIGAELDGAPGSIYYNNDPNNFIFECILLIKQMPKHNPVKSKIVVLEATPMLVYNHYGNYSNLFRAYAEIKDYCEKSNLTLNGPMREFYLSNPSNSNNPKEWLTRIMVPVINKP